MIGQMRDRVTIKRPVDTDVPGAGAESVYVLVFNDWCKVKTVRNSRVFQDSQINANDYMLFTVRWRSSVVIDKTMLIEYNGNDYTIQSPVREYADDKRNRFWLLTAISNQQPVQIIVS